MGIGRQNYRQEHDPALSSLHVTLIGWELRRSKAGNGLAAMAPPFGTAPKIGRLGGEER